MSQIKGLFGGAIAGTLVGMGGAVKDSPYEGFKPITFMRSPIVGAIVGSILYNIFKIEKLPVLILATIGGERIVVETWKILRSQKAGKFEFGEWGMERPEIEAK